MRGICPECKTESPVDANGRMTDHKDPYGSFSCQGVGMDCGMILKEKKNRTSKIRDDFYEEDEEETDSREKDDACCFDPTCDHGYSSSPPENKKIFGSIGSKILEVSDLRVFDPTAKKLTQKDRKARK